eukprot:1068553-Rhodomonas_salina.1
MRVWRAHGRVERKGARRSEKEVEGERERRAREREREEEEGERWRAGEKGAEARDLRIFSGFRHP